jgi:hypothetical protein
MSKRMKKIGILVGFLVGALAVASPVIAHHSFAAEFDTNKPVKLQGKLTEMKWANPHAWIHIDVVENGKTTNWALETNAANSLIRRGWRREDLKVGTVLKVEGWQARNGSPTANITRVTFEDGRQLFAGSSNPAAQEPKE